MPEALMPNTAFTWLVRGMLWMTGIGLLVLLIVSGLTVPLDNAQIGAALLDGADTTSIAIAARASRRNRSRAL